MWRTGIMKTLRQIKRRHEKITNSICYKTYLYRLFSRTNIYEREFMEHENSQREITKKKGENGLSDTRRMLLEDTLRRHKQALDLMSKH